MKILSVFGLATGVMLATAAPGLAQVLPDSGWSLVEAEQIAGKQLFKDHCAACHEQKAHAHFVIGPSLNGVVGRPAASIAGFPYSNALKKSGLTWTDENLHQWIADNEHMVPGILMPHVEIKDPAEITYLVEYLKTLKAPAKP